MAQARPVASMTGFARREGGDGQLTWSWEIKSVNGRSLDLRCRIPNGYERLEAAARAALPKACARGNINLQLAIERPDGTGNLRVNQVLLDEVVALAKRLERDLGLAPPSVDGLLAMRGVVESVEEADSAEAAAAQEAAMITDLEAVFEQLVAARRREGAQIQAVVTDHLAKIESLTAAAAASAAAQPEAWRARLKGQVEELLEMSPALPEERLAQEAALLAVRGDVREELDRLAGHVEAARALLADGGPIGRRLDFLCQEFNREANTLCSKSSDLALTRIGLDLKSAVEQLREQIQNLE